MGARDEFTFVKDEIERLTKDGVLGFYTHFEVTEVVAFRDRGAHRKMQCDPTCRT